MSSVDDYLEKETQDSNAWWRLSSGSSRNLFYVAVQERDELQAEVERLKAEVKYLNGANDNLAQQLQKLQELGDACERHCINPQARTAWREYREGQSDEC